MSDRRPLLNRVSQNLNEAWRGSDVFLEVLTTGQLRDSPAKQQEVIARVLGALVASLQEIAKAHPLPTSRTVFVQDRDFSRRRPFSHKAPPQVSFC